VKKYLTFSKRLLLHFTLIVLGVIWLLPTLGVLVTSFRPAASVAQTGWWHVFTHPFQQKFTIKNYAYILQRNVGGAMLGKAFLNSFVVTLPSTFLPISIAAFAALAFAWMKFPLRLTLFAYIVGFLTIPLQATVVPILRVYNKIGLSGTFVGIWFVHTGWGLPLLTYFLYNFFREFPHELIDAASVDGASSLQVFVRVIVPLSVPALASITIFQFLWVWNDLFAALLFLGGAPEVAPLTVALSTLVGSRGQGWELLTAAAFISSIVPLTIFFSLQRYFVRGILAGAIKA